MSRRPRLFSYTIPVDDGAAPNPFHGVCTLAICKPAIRRVAKPGDWVVGLGSKNAPSGDLSGRVVYAMNVDQVVTMEAYDRLAPNEWPHRIPDFSSGDTRDRLGDCLYDYSQDPPLQRRGVHGPGNIDTDIGGKNVLISSEFYYFGRKAIELAENLRAICNQRQGHRSLKNDPYVEGFIRWIRSQGFSPGTLHGDPDLELIWNDNGAPSSCRTRQAEGENDVEC